MCECWRRTNLPHTFEIFNAKICLDVSNNLALTHSVVTVKCVYYPFIHTRYNQEPVIAAVHWPQ